jgi:ADP-ribose pyrophosphatase YjhB (NUDIX family)
MSIQKNFPVTYNNEIYWISRAITVLGLVYTIPKDKEVYILANKRGPGTPNNQGYWNLPCGYLDFNETCKEACIREIYEETGVRIPTVYLWTVADTPDDSKQNVCLRYYCYLDSLPEVSVGNFGGEKDEVSEVKWIKLSDIENYKWAFNHIDIIKEFFSIGNPFGPIIDKSYLDEENT